MPRYAVLLDMDDAQLRPIALVTEHDDAVRVHFAVECGLKSVYRDAYVVREPDGSFVRYEPGDAEYFSCVLNTLSRAFVVKEPVMARSLAAGELVTLYRENVIQPRTTRQHVAYGGGLAVSLREALIQSCAYARATVYTVDEQPEPVAATESMLANAA